MLCQFLVLAGNWQFFCYGGKFLLQPEKKDTVVCLLGARFWQLRPGKKKDTVICLTGCAVVLFFVVAGNFDYDRKKKDTVVCLAGCAVVSVCGSGGKLAFFL